MSKPYTHDEFLKQARQYVAYWTNENVESSNPEPFTIDDVYVVWSCKTLQNSKALLATNNPDGMYFEATLNGDKNEIYFDAYKKVEKKIWTWE